VTAEVVIIIVNYRTPELTIDCLRSLEAEVSAHPDTRVIVVENGSRDDSAKAIAQAIAARGWSPWVALQTLEVNCGFAEGNNVAIRAVLAAPQPPTYFWLLNPDTVVRPGAAAALTDFMAAHPQVGIAGSRLEMPDGSVRISAFRFHSVVTEFLDAAPVGPLGRLLRNRTVAFTPALEPMRVDWVAGASLIVRTDLLRRIGLLDPHYFIYYEETDFCLRARRAGYECWYVPASRVVHLCGQSTGVTKADAAQRRRPPYWFKSRAYYFGHNHGRGYLYAANLGWLLGQLANRAVNVFRRHKHPWPPYLIDDFIRYSFRKTIGGQ
jgi:N-acetylglucosaminyl-diphospho-decaprenol L-rhamnosyltransferase